eukprot:scaffold9027_cov61-Attheya_sp.AAC.11
MHGTSLSYCHDVIYPTIEAKTRHAPIVVEIVVAVVVVSRVVVERSFPFPCPSFHSYDGKRSTLLRRHHSRERRCGRRRERDTDAVGSVDQPGVVGIAIAIAMIRTVVRLRLR